MSEPTQDEQPLLEHPFVAGGITDFCMYRENPEDQRCGYPEDRHQEPEEPEELQPDEVVTLFATFVTSLEPADLEGIVKAIESEPLPGDPDERRSAAMNRADRAELVRLFLSVRTTGRAIIRRLQEDAAGKLRDE